MTSTSTFVPAGSDVDRAEQSILVRDSDRDAGLDPATLAPPAETARPAIDPAALTDRIDQAWITPLDCDDDYDYDHTD
ncbi:hypothetical protein BJY24_006976 [Nocardia transvalensis]|uniref:Uncharacterized protein n=1 Tax=Nocardia transvalensis TaxID=37333 RepID=A0A7W9ULZ2_9NOCA|nr:hypothetical protein [Nocardia transvalensis]MBB5918064.1 hypothetical protein [Nocardia transvalensis]